MSIISWENKGGKKKKLAACMIKTSHTWNDKSTWVDKFELENSIKLLFHECLGPVQYIMTLEILPHIVIAHLIFTVT